MDVLAPQAIFFAFPLCFTTEKHDFGVKIHPTGRLRGGDSARAPVASQNSVREGEIRIETSKTQLLSKIRTMAFFFQMRLEKVFFTRTNAVSVSHQISLVFDDLRGHVSFSDKNQILCFSIFFAPIDLSSRRFFFSMYYFGGVRKVSGRSDNFVKNRRFSLGDTNSP